MTQSDNQLSRTKRIYIKSHYLRQLKEDETIELEYCPTNEMSADLLTKLIFINVVVLKKLFE